MVQYLLSVHSTEADPTPSPEVMERMYAQVDMFNQGLKASGSWVFAGGLHPASTATVVNATGGDVVTTDGPFAESQEHLGGPSGARHRCPGGPHPAAARWSHGRRDRPGVPRARGNNGQAAPRAKQKIKANRIPYRVPADAELPNRLPGVLATLHLVFNEGYLPSSRGSAIGVDLCAEAIRLARILASLMPDEPEVPEVQGLLALMALTDARRAARASGGALVPLPDQDRTRWDPELITEGHAIVRACLRRDRPGAGSSSPPSTPSTQMRPVPRKRTGPRSSSSTTSCIP